MVSLRSWCGLKLRMVFPKGEGSITALVKSSCNNVTLEKAKAKELKGKKVF